MTDQSAAHSDVRKSGAMQRADTANGEGAPDEVAARASKSASSAAGVRVLLAVDHSDHSVCAAKVAHQLFGDDVTYFVINVGPTEVLLPGGDPMAWGVAVPMTMPLVLPAPVVVPHGGAAAGSDVPSAVDRAAAEAQSVTAAAALPPDSVALGATGDPVEQICRVAADEAIDVIVVGSSSGGWWRHLLDPSVSKGVVRLADRPVLLVP